MSFFFFVVIIGSLTHISTAQSPIWKNTPAIFCTISDDPRQSCIISKHPCPTVSIHPSIYPSPVRPFRNALPLHSCRNHDKINQARLPFMKVHFVSSLIHHIYPRICSVCTLLWFLPTFFWFRLTGLEILRLCPGVIKKNTSSNPVSCLPEADINERLRSQPSALWAHPIQAICCCLF